MDDQRNDHIRPKRPKQSNRPKQLQTHNLPTNDVENINGTNKGKIYYLLTSRGLFPDEQKRCSKGTRGTAELLYIDQRILNESETGQKNLAMALIDYKKAYEMVPQNWIINCFKMYKISHQVKNFIEKTWRVEFTAGGKKLSWDKDPKIYFPMRSSITLIIHNCNDAT